MLSFKGAASRSRIPKTWKSATALFKSSIRDSIKSKNCSLSTKELNCILSQSWDSLSTSEQDEWQLKSDEDKARWTREVDEYQKAAQINEADFTNTALGVILGKSFDVDGIHQLVLSCLSSDSHAFESLSQVTTKSKQEKIKSLCCCRPPECQSAADLLRYLVEVKICKVILDDLVCHLYCRSLYTEARICCCRPS